MVGTDGRLHARIESSLNELRQRLAAGDSEEERTRQIEEAAEAVGEQAIDLLDRVGWFDQVHQIIALPEPVERFQILAELVLQDSDALRTEALVAGLEEDFLVTVALMRFLVNQGL